VIARIWHGYTKPEDADAYEAMLKPELLPGISKIKGYRAATFLGEIGEARSSSSQSCSGILSMRFAPSWDGITRPLWFPRNAASTYPGMMPKRHITMSHRPTRRVQIQSDPLPAAQRTCISKSESRPVFACGAEHCG